MKRSVVFILAVALTLGVASLVFAHGKQVTVTIGSGGNVIPWWPSFFPTGTRVQMLYDRSRINYAGTINEFELEKTSTATGTFTNVKFYLCHTKLSALTTNFSNNYSGTPVLVASSASYVVPARTGFYPIPMTTTFKYNNTDNLILEISWVRGSGSSCALRCGSLTGHRLWARSPTASTGTVDGVGYNGRISFSYYTAVSPTSLGRVKAMYE